MFSAMLLNIKTEKQTLDMLLCGVVVVVRAVVVWCGVAGVFRYCHFLLLRRVVLLNNFDFKLERKN